MNCVSLIVTRPQLGTHREGKGHGDVYLRVRLVQGSTIQPVQQPQLLTAAHLPSDQVNFDAARRRQIRRDRITSPITVRRLYEASERTPP